MSNKKSGIINLKILFRLGLVGCAVISAVALFGVVKYSAFTKKELLAQESGKKFAVLECGPDECSSGTYIDLEAATDSPNTRPSITRLAANNLKAISKALARSNVSYKLSGRLMLYEIGQCHNILRDSPETFFSLEFTPIEDELGQIIETTKFDQMSEEGPCKMRVRLISHKSNQLRYQIVNSLDTWSYVSSGLLWTWL